jgi:hypothetical protein
MDKGGPASRAQYSRTTTEMHRDNLIQPPFGPSEVVPPESCDRAKSRVAVFVTVR